MAREHPSRFAAPRAPHGAAISLAGHDDNIGEKPE
jgi:hypothetical protein